MKKGFLSEYFQSVSVKRLSSVEVNTEALVSIKQLK